MTQRARRRSPRCSRCRRRRSTASSRPASPRIPRTAGRARPTSSASSGGSREGSAAGSRRLPRSSTAGVGAKLLAWALAAARPSRRRGRAIARRPSRGGGAAPTRALSSPPELTFLDADSLGVSPDGRQLAFRRDLGDGSVDSGFRSLGSVEGPAARRYGSSRRYPFWSPDGRTIALLFSSGKLRRIDARRRLGRDDLRGGAGRVRRNLGSRTATSCSARTFGAPLIRVPASGGTPQPATALDAKRGDIGPPVALVSSGRAALHCSAARTSTLETTVALGDLDAVQSRTFLSPARIPARSGGLRADLLFVRERDALRAALRRRPLRPRGDPVAVTGTSGSRPTRSHGDRFSASATDPRLRALAAATGASCGWTGRARETGTLGPVGDYQERPDFSLGRSGRRVAFEIRKRAGISDVWIVDVDRGVGSPVSTERSTSSSRLGSRREQAHLSSRSQRILRSVSRGPAGGGSRDRADLDGLGTSRHEVSRTAASLVFGGSTRRASKMSGSWPWTGDRDSDALVETKAFQEVSARLSPDGRWIALHLRRVRADEVFVGALSADGTQVADLDRRRRGAGRWSRDGKEIFYVGLRRPPVRSPVRVPPVEPGDRNAAAALRPGSGPGRRVRSGAVRRQSDGRFLIVRSMRRIVGRPGRRRRQLAARLKK